MKKAAQGSCSKILLFPSRYLKTATAFFMGKSGKANILFVLVFCLLYLPFINKPVHIDDVSFITFSELIGWNPLDSHPVDFLHDGRLFKNSLPPYEMTHPLLIPYVIKIVSALFGQNEVALHLSFISFPLLGLVSLFMLYHVLFPDSENYGAIAAIALCSMPAFLVNSHNVMTDVPTLSFLMLAAACYSLSLENDSTLITYLGGISLCMAAFTSYQALFIIPVLFIYVLIKRRLNIHNVLSLALPLVALLIWFLLLYHTHDLFPLLKGRGDASQSLISNLIKMGLDYQTLIRKGISVLAFIGSSMLFLVPAYLLLNKSGGRFLLISLPLLAISYIAVFNFTGYSLAENVFLSALITVGLLTLLIVIKESMKTSDTEKSKGRGIFLLLWIFLVITYNMLIFPWIAARYILPLLPPLTMLLVNSLQCNQRPKKIIVIASALALSILFGLGNAYSDYKFADTYREVARDIKEFLPDKRVWYIGGWGMQYYMNKTGARYLLAESNDPQEGDFVVLPEMPRLWLPSPQLRIRLEYYAGKTYASALPLRLFNGRSHAGFYSNAWGMLPFSFSREPDEVFQLYRVLR